MGLSCQWKHEQICAYPCPIPCFHGTQLLYWGVSPGHSPLNLLPSLQIMWTQCLCVCAMPCGCSQAAKAAPWTGRLRAGRPLRDAIADLRKDGLAIGY